MAGTTITVGRWSTDPTALATSVSVAGAGAVALTGPDRPSSPRQWRITPISSSSVIQLRYWSPVPILPPRPARKSGSCFPQAPPWRLSTIPVRSSTVRMPPSAAGRGRRLPGAADVGQEALSAGRALGQLLVAPVAVEPHRRGADEHRGTVGQSEEGVDEQPGRLGPAVQDGCLRAGDQRRSPMPAAARRTTPSKGPACVNPAHVDLALVRGPGDVWLVPTDGGVVDRTRRVTACPSRRARSTRAVPIRPDPPLTNRFMTGTPPGDRPGPPPSAPSRQRRPDG